MIEIELFQRESSCDIHTAKIWLDGKLAYANEIGKLSELIELRNDLHSELFWLDEYLREKGVF